MCGLCMSNALGDWQAFEAASFPDAVSMRTQFVQPVADAGLADLAELFPAVKSFADIAARLQDKQAGAGKWADIIEDLFAATDTSLIFEHGFAVDAAGAGLGEALNELGQLLGGQQGNNQPDLQPMYTGTAEGGTASGSPVGFNQDMVDQVDSGSYWYNSGGQIAPTISFGFTTSNSFAAGYGEQSGWSTFTSAQKDAAREMMGLWDDLVAPSFVEDTGSPNTADIKFSNSTTNTGFAHAYYPGQVGAEAFQFQKIQGSVWLNPNYNSGVNNLVTPQSGVYGYMAIAHEIGHALGLNHPGNYNGGSPAYGNGSTGWLYEEDSHQYTIMSYFNASYTGAAWNGKYAQTPMVYDILAIQQLYGADYTTRATDTTYGFNSTAGNWIYDYTQNTSPVMTIWDGDGTDTIDLSGWSTSSTLSLTAGSYSSVNNMTYNLAIAYDVDIENAIGGSGNDNLDGNDLDNIITGNAGNDTINGHFGNDTLYGGDGNDTLDGGEGDDWLDGGSNSDIINGGADNDTIVFDAADSFTNLTGGAGWDTLFFYDNWQDLDLAAQGFEQSQVQISDNGAETWATITDTYDLNDNLTERLTVNDDGTSSLTVYDFYNVETWSDWTRNYDGNGTLLSEVFSNNADIIEDNGAVQLAVNANAVYQVTEGVGAPVILKYGGSDVGPASLAGWSALQAEATATGFTVLWHHTDGRYAVCQTDAAGNYLSSTSQSEASLNEIEVLFAADLNGNGGIGVIENNGAYSLSLSAAGAYQISNGVATPVVLEYGGSDVGPGSLAGWSALQAEANDTGFAVLWQHTDGRYVVWKTSAAGVYESSYSLQEAELSGLETLFAADLDGDGGTGVIEDNGAYQLSVDGNGVYQVSDGVGTSVGLEYNGSDVGPATFAGWSAVQTEANDTGFSVLWLHDDGRHIVWQTDTAGVYEGSYSVEDSQLSGLEPLFAADINGDGAIGVIENNGAHQLSVGGDGAYQLSDGVGSPVVLEYNNADVGPTTLAGWSAIQAEAIDTGFAVLWNHTDDRYVVWETDTTGVYESSYVVPETQLTGLETLFAADLNGDGGIGLV